MPRKPFLPFSISENLQRAKTRVTRLCRNCNEEKTNVKLRKCQCGYEEEVCLKCFEEHKNFCDYSFCNFCTFEFSNEDVIVNCSICGMPLHDYCEAEHMKEAHLEHLL